MSYIQIKGFYEPLDRILYWKHEAGLKSRFFHLDDQNRKTRHFEYFSSERIVLAVLQRTGSLNSLKSKKPMTANHELFKSQPAGKSKRRNNICRLI